MLRPYRHQNLWHGCVGAWCPSQAHSGGTLIDYSNFNNHGTLTFMDPATDWVTSGGGWALDFDGVDDYIATTCNVPQLRTAATVAGWFYPRRSHAAGVREFWWGCNNGFWDFSFQLFTDNNAYIGWFGPADYRITLAASSTYLVTQWQHLAFVSSVSFGSRLYRDGVLVGSNTTPPSGLNDVNVNLAIANNLSVNTEFNGQLDDFRVYNRALTESEIRLLATKRGIAYERKPRLWAVKAPASGGAFTLTANGGTFNETGQDAQLEKGFLVTGEVGSLNETGQAANLLKGYTTTFDVGTFNETGQDASLLATRRLSIDAGTFSVSGQDATLTKTSANSLAADAASFSLVGQDATLRIGRLLTADATSFVFAGQDANLAKGRTLTADAGSFNETGQDALLRRTARLAIDAASFTLTGQNAQLTFAGGGLVPAPYYYQMMMGG